MNAFRTFPVSDVLTIRDAWKTWEHLVLHFSYVANEPGGLALAS